MYAFPAKGQGGTRVEGFWTNEYNVDTTAAERCHAGSTPLALEVPVPFWHPVRIGQFRAELKDVPPR
jgi:hypothetical protein